MVLENHIATESIAVKMNPTVSTCATSEHVSFLWNAMKDFVGKIQNKSVQSPRNISAHLIETCKAYYLHEQESSTLINEKEMCPFCFNLWSNGQCQIKSRPKVKRKGKYKVTALELLCLKCKKKVKINNSKIKRSAINTKIEKRMRVNKKKKMNENSVMVETPRKDVKYDESKKEKIKNDSLSKTKQESPAPVNQPQFSPKISSVPTFQKNMKMKYQPADSSNIIQKKSAEKKRMKFQKHLNKSLTPTKPRSSLENFLNSVDKF